MLQVNVSSRYESRPTETELVKINLLRIRDTTTPLDLPLKALVEGFKLENRAILSKHFIKQTLADNRETLRKYGVKQIGLFGSYVNGTSHTASDIDLLVELERSTFDDYMGLVLFLEDLFGKKVDLVAVKSVKSDLKPYIEKQVEYVVNL